MTTASAAVTSPTDDAPETDAREAERPVLESPAYPAFLRVLPTAKVGHIGLRRDHATLLPHTYYLNLPPSMAARPAFLLDPMLATGGSAVDAIGQLRHAGATDITLVCILAAPEGLRRVESAHPDVRIVAGAVDRELNSQGYILPGLGDAGDRIFGTL